MYENYYIRSSEPEPSYKIAINLKLKSFFDSYTLNSWLPKKFMTIVCCSGPLTSKTEVIRRVCMHPGCLSYCYYIFPLKFILPLQSFIHSLFAQNYLPVRTQCSFATNSLSMGGNWRLLEGRCPGVNLLGWQMSGGNVGVRIPRFSADAGRRRAMRWIAVS